MNNSLKNSYFYDGNAGVLAQLIHGIDPNTFETTVEDKYFYIKDRLGSVRLMITGIADEADTDWADVVNSYTYDPYGNDFTAETTENAYNPFKFTGQWYDSEINQYYLRARQYDPQLMRFTTRDPVRGKFNNPLTVHRYLYCINDPINNVDPSGEIVVTALVGGVVVGAAVKAAVVTVAVVAIAYAIAYGIDQLFDAAIGMSKWNGEGWDPNEKMIYEYNQGVSDNGMGNFNLPPGSGIAGITALALYAIYENRDAIEDFLDDIIGWSIGSEDEIISP